MATSEKTHLLKEEDPEHDELKKAQWRKVLDGYKTIAKEKADETDTMELKIKEKYLSKKPRKLPLNQPEPSKQTRKKRRPALFQGWFGKERSRQDRHFVDIHRAALIQRVTSVAGISDDLLGVGVLNKEKYNDVNTQGLTNEDRMRRLYDVISASGRGGKDLFYKSLQKHEKFIVKDLRG